MGVLDNELNEQQRAAVDYDAGPLAVLAGPGTGKTRVITHRVERLIKGGARPESIVALTFTVKAAEQLRERLAGLVGGAAADRVNAHTFHGFGWRLVQRFKDLLGLPAELKVIDGPRVRRLMRDLIIRHGLYPGLEAAGRRSAVADALAVIHRLSNNGTFPDEAAAFAGEWLERLNGKDHGLDEAGLGAARARRARFAEDVRLYGLYSAECARRGWLGFDDLILLPIRLLRAGGAGATICRDDYRHFVVDEFQDVNAGQIELLRLLAPPASRPDLCVVGDDDQSIYEFRGADDRAFAKFERVWGLSEADRVALTQNYRSERPIVDVANAVMDGAEYRFAPEKTVELPAGKGAPEAGAAVECVTIDDDASAGETIAAMILHDGGAWDRYAVITRSNTDLDRAAAALEIEGIPVRRVRGRSALDDRGVQDVLAWVDVLGEDAAAAVLGAHRLLTRPPLSAPPARVRELTIEYSQERSRARLDGRMTGPGFLEWLAGHADDPGVGPAIRRLAALREELRGATALVSADAAAFEIVKRTDVAHAELLAGSERAARVAALTDFLRFVRESADALDPPGDLAAFRAFYAELTDADREMRGDISERVDGPAEGGAPEDRAEAVAVLTAHTAKGLEFDTVFVPRVRPGGYPPSRREEESALPEGLVDRAGDERTGSARRAAEERRLFYVACTRAERRLVLLAKAKKSRGDATDFFCELTLDPPCNSIVIRRTGAEVLNAAAEAGVKLAAVGAVGVVGVESRVDAREVLERARAGARLLAAQALSSVERADASPEAITSAGEALREAAERVALVAAIKERGAAPAWAAGTKLDDYATRLVRAVKAREGGGTSAMIFRPLVGPLSLSYTWIEEYGRCPRCFYFRRVMGVPEPAGTAQVIGQVVHESLAEYYQGVMDARDGGRARPSAEMLLKIGRERFLAGAGAGQPSGEEQLRQVLAQLTLACEKLCDAKDDVEAVERKLRFPYPHAMIGADGKNATQSHWFNARFDRLDRLLPPRAGHRIVDYKTGQARKKHTEPKPDDLQLGVYAMALRWHQDGSPEGARSAEDLLRPAAGEAEYWVMATGERGRIGLDQIAYAKVKARIDKAVTGMLKGEFPQGSDCWKLCPVLA